MPFGQPYRETPISPDIMNAAPVSQIAAPPMNLMEMAQPKPSFFGQGGVGRNIAGMIGDVLLRRSGAQPLFAPFLQAQQQAALENQQYEHRKADSWDLWQRQQQWERDHPNKPAPTEYERALVAAGIVPGSPEYVQHMKQYLQMKENPVWTYTDPATGAVMMGSKAPPQSEVIPTLPVGAKPLGGPTPTASGGFPRR